MSPQRKRNFTLHPRNVDYMKPAKFKSYKTLNEVAREVGRDPTRILQLEKQDRIPVAARVAVGTLQVRLWSPKQVEEIKTVLSTMRPGRPKS